MLPGTEAMYPLTVMDVRTEPDALVVVGYNKYVNHRADTLDGAVFTARFTSPMPDVIRVQITHFKGRRPRLPVFDLDYSLSNPDVEIGRDGVHTWLKTGDLSVVVPVEGNWRVDYLRGGRPLTSSEHKAIGLFKREGKTYLREQLTLQPGETIYGLGERFTPFVRNGQSVDIWQEDGGTNSRSRTRTFRSISAARVWRAGEQPGLVSYEIASHHVTRTQFSVEGHSLDYYLFGGPTPKAALEQYTALSGRPALPPEWSFGLWLSTSFTTNYSEADVMANIDRMESLGIPISVFHFDCFWMKELTWCSFLWDRENFPDPEGMLRRIHDKGIKVCVWINPYIAELSPLFDEGMEHGYLLQTPEGDVYQVDDWQPGMGLIGFTNPDTRLVCQQAARLARHGRGHVQDRLRRAHPDQCPLLRRQRSERMPHFITYPDRIRRWKGQGAGEAVVFGRSATWQSEVSGPLGRDSSSAYVSMAETLRGNCRWGCAVRLWSHDISGFIDTATPDLYKRWVAFGLLSSHSRLHGSSSVRMPWLFGDEAVDVLRHFNNLKKRIMPYLMDAAREARDHGWPMARAMVLEFPDDPACKYLDMQYMLGAALLVAPIFSDTSQVTYYLPGASGATC